MINEEQVLRFQRLFEQDCGEDEAYHVFCSLNPSVLSTDTLLEIVRWVEKSAIHLDNLPEHVNFFGTGGDCPNDNFGNGYILNCY